MFDAVDRLPGFLAHPEGEAHLADVAAADRDEQVVRPSRFRADRSRRRVRSRPPGLAACRSSSARARSWDRGSGGPGCRTSPSAGVNAPGAIFSRNPHNSSESELKTAACPAIFARPPASGAIARSSQLPVKRRSLFLFMSTPGNEKGPHVAPVLVHSLPPTKRAASSPCALLI